MAKSSCFCGWVWREFLQGWFMAASWVQLQTQTGQDWLTGTSQLHLCSRRTSEGNGIHCTRTLVGPQRHVANSEGKCLGFPRSSSLMQEKRHVEAWWNWTCSGATLSCVFKMDFSLREKGLNQTKMLQAKLPAVFNYFRGLKCSQMSLWGSQAHYQSRFLGACPSTELCKLQQMKFDDSSRTSRHCPDSCWPSCRLPESSTQALDDIYLIRTTWALGHRTVGV